MAISDWLEPPSVCEHENEFWLERLGLLPDEPGPELLAQDELHPGNIGDANLAV